MRTTLNIEGITQGQVGEPADRTSGQPQLLIRQATPADLPTLTAIENQSFPDASWTAEQFLQYDCLVADTREPETPGLIVGFLVSRLTFAGNHEAPPEREILNLAVSPDFRRAGIATLLLHHEIERRAHLFLEVRESNLAARSLYRKLGFAELSRRTSYYQNPRESAIVMQLKW